MKKNCGFLWMCALAMGMAFLFSSCGDTDNALSRGVKSLLSVFTNKDVRLDDAIEGSWVLTEEPVEGDEIITQRTTEMQFNKFEKGEVIVEDKLYGPYQEIRKLHYKNYRGNSILSCTLSGIITGQWNIEEEYLYLTCFMDNIEVSMDDFDWEWKDGDRSCPQPA